MPPRKAPTSIQSKAPELTPSQELAEAFNVGIKKTVTPRGGEPVELVIRQFYTGQALEIVDQLEKLYGLMKQLSNENGDVDLMELFRTAQQDVFQVLCIALEVKNEFLLQLEIDDLLDITGTVFNINKDFFAQRVKGRLTEVLGEVFTTH